MKVSVVISTYNRAASLEATLCGLRHQTHEPFEVIVVNGPSTDRTRDLLETWRGQIRVGHCAERHLAMSRNIGVQLAAGEIVAFIDDDAIPEPQWLCELVRAYATEDTGGAGGIVYDPSGLRLQYKYAVCDRTGQARFDVDRPLPEYTVRGADPFIYLQGTNMSFRRALLQQIGGFNEEFEHYFDDVEMAMQVIDHGCRVQALPGAAVHHKYLASKVRDGNGVFIDPFVIVKSRFYFGLKYGCGPRSRHQVAEILAKYAQSEREQAASHFESGRLTKAQYERSLSRIEEAIETGRRHAAAPQRPGREIPPPPLDDFLPFPTLKPQGRRLRICFISHDFPPDDYGGVGRYTADLAADFARRGHEVHVITAAKGDSRIDFQDGCWLHRLAPIGRWIAELEGVAITQNLLRLWSAYDEVRRIHQRAPVDLVSAPLWLCEGLLCSFDSRFPTVLTLMTAMATIAGYHPSWADTDHTRQLITLEHETFAAARHIHAISRDILRKSELTYGESRAQKFIIPLGIKDRAREFTRRRPWPPEVPVRVLFTGRLERRKGVDLLLQAAVRLIEQRCNVEFVFAGKDTINTELGETYRAAFEREFARNPEVLAGVRFTDWVTDDELMQHYADADICCFPSRYESFGLVVVEAMSFAKPVVAFDIGGVKEIVEQRRSGLLVKPESAEELAGALRRLIEDAALRSEFGARSRALFEQHFRLEHTAGELLDQFQRIADVHRERPVPAPELAQAQVEQSLAPIIARLSGKPLQASIEISRQFLSNDRETARVQADMRALWERPDEEFVRGLYALLFGRPADPRGLKSHLGALKWGIPRLSLVQRFLDSEEAKRLDSSWRAVVYESAAQLGGPQPSRNGSAPTLRSKMAVRMYRAFPALRGPAERLSVVARSTDRQVHKLMDYIRYWIYLPITVHDSMAELSRRSQDLSGRVDHVQRTLEQAENALSRSIATVDHSITELRGESVSGLKDIRADSRAMAAAAADLRALGDNNSKALSYALEHLNNLAGYIGALPKIAADQKALAEWVRLLQRKMEILALDLRELGAGRQPEISEPAIVDPAAYSHKLAEMGDLIRVNLGCGEKPLAGYINIDCRRVPEVDVVADVRRLPFGERSLFEIHSAHLVEHFPANHLRRVILPYWKTLLRSGGILRTVCPNWQAMIQHLSRGEMSLEDFHLVTFGGQEYDTDTHFAMYTPGTFSAILTETGFRNIQIVSEQRQNGLCPEMEILAEA
jgi:glycogen(starch) synthase